jgi:hypothetical protein
MKLSKQELDDTLIRLSTDNEYGYDAAFDSTLRCLLRDYTESIVPEPPTRPALEKTDGKALTEANLRNAVAQLRYNDELDHFNRYVIDTINQNAAELLGE